MTPDAARGPLLTLEPFSDAVRTGADEAAWAFSGMQKTTSTEFDGRWDGEETRSAYLFFHHPRHPACSVDVFLDETARGLRGNLALVADVRPLWELVSVPDALRRLADLTRDHLPSGYRTPVTLRLRLADPDEDAVESELEARLKLVIPRVATEAGAGAVAALVSSTLRAFETILADPGAAAVLDLDDAGADV